MLSIQHTYNTTIGFLLLGKVDEVVGTALARIQQDKLGLIHNVVNLLTFLLKTLRLPIR